MGKRVGMTVGPWQHGSRTSCSPFALGYKPCFDMFGAAVRRMLPALVQRDVEPCCDSDFIAIRAFLTNQASFLEEHLDVSATKQWTQIVC